MHESLMTAKPARAGFGAGRQAVAWHEQHTDLSDLKCASPTGIDLLTNQSQWLWGALNRRPILWPPWPLTLTVTGKPAVLLIGSSSTMASALPGVRCSTHDCQLTGRSPDRPAAENSGGESSTLGHNHGRKTLNWLWVFEDRRLWADLF